MCKARSFVAVAAVGGYLYAIGGSVCWLSWSLVCVFFGGSLGKLQLLHLQERLGWHSVVDVAVMLFGCERLHSDCCDKVVGQVGKITDCCECCGC
ncbi:MAG: hypothetical protein LGB78_00015 [Sulfurovum sp.]|nr:hypothetical protein [Sulfurovum sp.]MCB4776537.1 hypothetical protein [Sulfurovum sp.]MCB4779455.1 hypothetical protein [Sulfurovum sp.]